MPLYVFGLMKMYRVLGVSENGYYRWESRPAGAREKVTKDREGRPVQAVNYKVPFRNPAIFKSWEDVKGNLGWQYLSDQTFPVFRSSFLI